MATITFDRFDLGIDLRKGASVSDANRLREMKNMYVTTGLSTAKRPGLSKIATLPAGTTGLASAFGRLQTFSTGNIVLSNGLVNNNVLNAGGKTLKDIDFCDAFNAYLYVAATFTDGKTKHFYNNQPVTDANCPHTKACIRAASKMFAVSPDGDTVRFSKTGDPTVWTAADDAGFLPTGLNALGDRTTCALGMYRTQIVSLSRDGCEVWKVDADPTAMALTDHVANVGTSFPRTVTNVGGDLYFLSDYGFRSIGMQAWSDNMIDVDVGSPIDSLVRQALKERGSIEPKSFYFYGTGQYVCALANRLFVYSVSKTAKINAWSQYLLSCPVDAVAQLGQDLYIRSGDDIYLFDSEAATDAGERYECYLEMPWMDFKRPGVLKMVYGMDIVCEGSCEVSLGFNANNASASTPFIPVHGNTRPTGIIPVQCAGTEFSPRIYCYNDEPFELEAITLYYNEMGYV